MTLEVTRLLAETLEAAARGVVDPQDQGRAREWTGGKNTQCTPVCEESSPMQCSAERFACSSNVTMVMRHGSIHACVGHALLVLLMASCGSAPASDAQGGSGSSSTTGTTGSPTDPPGSTGVASSSSEGSGADSTASSSSGSASSGTDSGDESSTSSTGGGSPAYCEPCLSCAPGGTSLFGTPIGGEGRSQDNPTGAAIVEDVVVVSVDAHTAGAAGPHDVRLYGFTAEDAQVFSRVVDHGPDDNGAIRGVGAGGYPILVGAIDSNAGDRDFLLEAISPNGDPVWTNIVDTGGPDFPRFAAVDAQGRIVIGMVAPPLGPSGRSVWAQAHGADGGAEWTAQWDIQAEFVSPSGYAVLSDEGDLMIPGLSAVEFGDFTDAWLHVLAPDGSEVWQTSFSTPGFDDRVRAAADFEEGYFVTHAWQFNNIVEGAVVYAFDADGAQRWSAPFDPPTAFGTPQPLPNGDVLIAAESSVFDERDIVIRGYSFDGELLLSDSFGAPDAPDDLWFSLVDDVGRLILSGSSGVEGNRDAWVRAYDASGLLWAWTYDSGFDDRGGHIAVDACGDTFVFGRQEGAPVESYLAHLDPDGEEVWLIEPEFQASADEPLGLLIGPAGHPFMIARVRNALAKDSFFDVWVGAVAR